MMKFFKTFVPILIKYDFVCENSVPNVSKVWHNTIISIFVFFFLNPKTSLRDANVHNFFSFWFVLGMDWMPSECEAVTERLSMRTNHRLSQMVPWNDATFLLGYWLHKDSEWPG